MAMVDMMPYRPSDVEAETRWDSLTLADTLALVEPKTLGNTLFNVEAVTLVDTLVLTLAEVEAKTPSDTVGDVEAKAWSTRWVAR